MHRRTHIQPRFWLFIIALMLIVFGLSFAVAQSRFAGASARLNSLAAQKESLRTQVADLSDQLDYVRTDDYVERVARDELNMIRSGEIRYVAG